MLALPFALLLPLSPSCAGAAARLPGGRRTVWILDTRAVCASGRALPSEVIGLSGPGGSDPIRLWQGSVLPRLRQGGEVQGTVAYSDCLLFRRLAREAGMAFACGEASTAGGAQLLQFRIGPAVPSRGALHHAASGGMRTCQSVMRW